MGCAVPFRHAAATCSLSARIPDRWNARKALAAPRERPLEPFIAGVEVQPLAGFSRFLFKDLGVKMHLVEGLYPFECSVAG